MDVQEPGSATQTTGEYRVGDEVLASIAALAASEVEGVAGLSGGTLGEVFGVRHPGRGVRVEAGVREAAFDVHLQVVFGVQIPVVAQRVQENVKRAVEAMTGLEVVEVNVHVSGVEERPALGTRGLAPAGPTGSS